MNDQLQQVIRDQLLEAVQTAAPDFTRRLVALPRVKNKAVCVIGMRRAGKTTFLHQCRADLMAAGRTRKSGAT